MCKLDYYQCVRVNYLLIMSSILSNRHFQPQGLDELTIEHVKDDVEIETDGQSDAFAVSIQPGVIVKGFYLLIVSIAVKTVLLPSLNNNKSMDNK